ncbi:hypothetical protein HNR43_001285 [Anoxybacillus mongoliensis]|uniref:Uncharacterized protein n=1 Tax=Anoxybacillus mongoliensis TaxID=452565 RepID=A0A7W8JEL5_9BACL|nr:hypothetical protein [Anoxybacillus mongoliensis]MBB5355313.1 hypothetical protein [Anoxybacillus mongoliensis]
MKVFLKEVFLSTALLFLSLSLLSSWFFAFSVFVVIYFACLCGDGGVVATLVSMPFYPSVASVLMLEQLDTISEEDYLRKVSFIIYTIPYGVVFCFFIYNLF